MKILVLVDFAPSLTVHQRASFNMGMVLVKFSKLPGALSGWVADNKFPSLAVARDATMDAASDAGAEIVRAYLVEYDGFMIHPQA